MLDLRLDTITDGRTAFIHLTRSLLLDGAAALLRPDAPVFQLRQDVSIGSDALEACRSLNAVLSLRVLRCIISAAFAIRREVRSLREALLLRDGSHPEMRLHLVPGPAQY